MNIVKFPHFMLKQTATEVEVVNEQVIRLIRDMTSTMREHMGCGIAAPQVGVMKRIVIVSSTNGILAMINPVIAHMSKTSVQSTEGCLSLPGFHAAVCRAKVISVNYMDERGHMNWAEEFKGNDAIIIQHEVDHLNGTTIKDVALKI